MALDYLKATAWNIQGKSRGEARIRRIWAVRVEAVRDGNTVCDFQSFINSSIFSRCFNLRSNSRGKCEMETWTQGLICYCGLQKSRKKEAALKWSAQCRFRLNMKSLKQLRSADHQLTSVSQKTLESSVWACIVLSVAFTALQHNKLSLDLRWHIMQNALCHGF